MKRKAATGGRRRRSRFRFPFRFRLPVVAALAFAALVLATSMPVGALLTQHRQLDSAAAALSQARAADRSLSAQVQSLDDATTIDELARSDYGLVPPGQKAYVILPPAGATSSAVTGSGHVPLDEAPVVPGSALARQLLGLAPLSAVTSGVTGASPSASSTSGPGRPASASPAANDPGGFWSRVVRSLEFWR